MSHIDPSRPAPVLQLSGVSRVHGNGAAEVHALRGVDLTVHAGEFVAVMGPSGSGKSTLLTLAGGLDLPSDGQVLVEGVALGGLSRGRLADLRRRSVGYVFQDYNLIPALTAAENIALPMQLRGRRATAAGSKGRAARVAELMDALEIGHLAHRRPNELSGGQQQRVAIAVAMANNPPVLLADEPTGELDSETAGVIFESFRTVNRELGTTVVIVTHDPMVAAEVRRTVAIRDGRTSSEVLRRTVTDEHGEESVNEREYVMLDRTGRVQLPVKFLEALGMEHRVAVDLATDHIEIRPDDLVGG